jgi:hypothetical protein
MGAFWAPSNGIIGWSMEDGFRELERKLEATFRLVNK